MGAIPKASSLIMVEKSHKKYNKGGKTMLTSNYHVGTCSGGSRKFIFGGQRLKGKINKIPLDNKLSKYTWIFLDI